MKKIDWIKELIKIEDSNDKLIAEYKDSEEIFWNKKVRPLWNISCHDSITYKCKCGEEHKQIYYSIKVLKKSQYCKFTKAKLYTWEDCLRIKKELLKRNIEWKINSFEEYKGARIRYTFKCLIDNHEWIASLSSLSGKRKTRCPKCVGGVKSNTNDFIEKAKQMHGDKFDYTKVDYKGNNTKVIITCKIHGDFQQTPGNHLSGTSCPKCVGRNKTTNDFIEKAKQIHGDKFDYTKVDYKGNNTKVIITCKIHGDFQQTPGNHLQGKGCLKCAGVGKSNTNDFIEKAQLVHSDKYDYSKVDYKGVFTKVIITCKIHGDFLQTPGSHLQGKGCPKCAGIGKLLPDEINKRLEPIGYELISDYINSSTPVTIRNKITGETLTRTWSKIQSRMLKE
jgi:hypothetical protein